MKFAHAFTLTALAAIAFAGTSSINANAEYKSAPAAEQLASDTQQVSTGTFSGRTDHVTSGDVTLEKTASGYQLRFAGDFFLDGAPDPVVAIGNNETFLKSNKIGKLKRKKGAQVYILPAGFTPADFSEVYVWCEKFSVPLGVATLNS